MFPPPHEPQALSVESVEERVPGPVGHAAASVSLATLAVFVGLASEGALINLALGGTGERHAWNREENITQKLELKIKSIN